MTVPDSVTPWWQQLWQHQKENLLLVLLAIVLALVIRGWVAEPRFIPSDSMLPTLHVGDRLLVEKISYQLHTPQPGDIVVFQPPQILQQAGYGADQAFIKRVIARSGQTVQVHKGQVWVDGQPLTEPYVAELPAYEWGPYPVPEHCLFVMGDNRNNSNDSHIWGFLPERNVIGRAWVRFWPLDRWGRVTAPAIGTRLEQTAPLG